MLIRHKKTDAIPDNPAEAAEGRVLPSDWNDTHNIDAVANLSFIGNVSGSPASPVAVPISTIGGYIGATPAADGMVTVHETVFAGMATQTFVNNTPVTLSDGLTYRPTVPAGTTWEINANGLRATQSSSAEGYLWLQTGDQPGSKSVFYNKLGPHILRTHRPWGIWARLHAYTLENTGWFYVNLIGCAYAESFYGIRRSRNTAGTPHNSTGGLLHWRARGVDQEVRLSAAAYTDATTDVYHDTGELVTLFMFHDPWKYSIYYGDWSGGWPALADMKFGGAWTTWPTKNDAMGVHIELRDPRIWHFGFGGGIGDSRNEFTVNRWRLTYW